MKILYPFANVLGLFFPVGKMYNGGTCEFASNRCLEKCCAHLPGAGMKIGYEIKREIFDYFLGNSPGKIVKQLLSELKEADCKIFTWFASGECPSFLTSKFFDVVKGLDNKSIIQTGFTRNEELWELCNGLSGNNNKVLLTIEEEYVKDITKEGLYSIPNYDLGAIDIYCIAFGSKKVRRGYGCGGGYYTDHVKTIERGDKDTSHLKLDCKACYENKTGCFIEMEEK